jgi:hypothetical protein
MLVNERQTAASVLVVRTSSAADPILAAARADRAVTYGATPWERQVTVLPLAATVATPIL